MDNVQRAERAQFALEEYRQLLEDDGEVDLPTICTDLISDLLHLFAREGYKPVERLQDSVNMAEIHFNAERG